VEPTSFQKAVADFVAAHDLEIPVQARLLDLVSEIGEMAKEVMKATHYGRQPFHTTDEWAGELADALFALVCVANSTGVDLEAALAAALEKYAYRLAQQGDPGSGQ
jgi:NTP pyrophosphatase (non-canonical NTP hydrolase)